MVASLICSSPQARVAVFSQRGQGLRTSCMQKSDQVVCHCSPFGQGCSSSQLDQKLEFFVFQEAAFEANSSMDLCCHKVVLRMLPTGKQSRVEAAQINLSQSWGKSDSPFARKCCSTPGCGNGLPSLEGTNNRRGYKEAKSLEGLAPTDAKTYAFQVFDVCTDRFEVELGGW